MTEKNTEQSEVLLPPPPQPPLASDCCGTGCTPCVFDLYDNEVKLWEEECERLRCGVGTNTPTDDCVIHADRYTTFELLSITPVTSDTNIYRFLLPNRQRLPLSAGQHLLLRCVGDGQTVVRQFTPVSDCLIRGSFEVIIKLYESGQMSGCVRKWRAGDLIEWRGPHGNFHHAPNRVSRLVMLAAGTGVAPMIQVIRSVLQNEDDDTHVHLVYTTRSYSSLLCKSQLDEWSGFWNFTATYYITQESTNDRVRYGDKVLYSRLTQEDVAREIGDPMDNVRVLICGTKSFDKAMINYVKKIGLTPDRYHKF